MKALKEPLARMANKEDDCTGTFWESRYKSIAILDEEALLATCAYIDLNPFAAGLSSLPETAKYTSVRQRVSHVKAKGKLKVLQAARRGPSAGSKKVGELDQDHWLLPFDDRSGQDQDAREGMFESFSLSAYLQVLDYTSRLCRSGKAHLDAGVKNILERLGTSGEVWGARLQQMLSSKSLYGHCFAGNSERVRELASRTGHHHLANLSPQPASPQSRRRTPRRSPQPPS